MIAENLFHHGMASTSRSKQFSKMFIFMCSVQNVYIDQVNIKYTAEQQTTTHPQGTIISNNRRKRLPYYIYSA